MQPPQLPSNAVVLPPPKRQLGMEIEKFEKLVKLMDSSKTRKKEDSSALWMEAVTRRDSYLMMTGLRYMTPVTVPSLEKNTLIRLFQHLQGHSWMNKQGWVGQAKTVTKPEVEVFESDVPYFEGIECTKVSLGKSASATVSLINLNGNGCRGTLPLDFGNIENLKFLDMNWNLVVGELPKSLSNIDGLQRIGLAGNLLEGSLDAESFAKFKALRTLDLSFNRFTGPLPDIFDNYSALVSLNLSGNKFSGPLPESMSTLVKLKSLKLFNNELSGPIAPWIGSLTSLQNVNLSQNRFSSGIAYFFNCQQLETLVLNDNLLVDDVRTLCPELGPEAPVESGAVVRAGAGAGEGTMVEQGKEDQEGKEKEQGSEAAVWPKLHTLYLQFNFVQNNRLKGTFPVPLCSVRSLKRLNLSNNDLRGVLPEDIANLENVEVLLLSGNAFRGPMPRSISRLGRLRDLRVFKDVAATWTSIPKGFNRHIFERIYVVGPSLGLDTVCWEEGVMEAHKPSPNSTSTPSVAKSAGGGRRR